MNQSLAWSVTGRGLGVVARRTLGVVLTAFVAVGMVGCSTNPTTGRMQFNSLTPEQEIAIGAEAAPQLTEEYGGAVADQRLQGYITQVGQRMLPYTEGDAPSLPWEFVLLDSDVINAFALPGGKVFMSRGLADRMTNEAQLASVLGHEIGHVTARHVNERVTQSRVVTGLLTAGVAVAGTSDSGLVTGAVQQIMGSAGQGYLLKYGRDQELEADALGVRYMAKAGYDPLGALQVQQILKSASEGQLQPEILSTHPHPESRIRALQEMLAGEYAPTQNNPRYQLYEDRFKASFLDRLATLPPAPDASTTELVAADWCGLCRAQTQQQMSAVK
jgi:predicted Zn-dependent protease